jgi:hypothetical protein
MPAHDASEFVDSDFQSARQSAYAAPLPGAAPAEVRLPNRPPTGEELEALVSQKHLKLAELKRAQEELERERAGLEELRRRQMELQTGRAEMIQHLTRGIGLLDEAELSARRDAEQMARALAEFRDAVAKVQSINEQAWTQENFPVELTRALTIVENARMEWNSARLKFPILTAAPVTEPGAAAAGPAAPFPGNAGTGQLFKIGFFLHWPLWLVGLGILIALLLRR